MSDPQQQDPALAARAGDGELLRRPSRPPDYEAENSALVALAAALSNQPEHFLQRLADTALRLCRAGSAGLSIREQFLATLAHELRNPLAPLRNGLEILRRVHGDDPMAVSARSIMERQVEHMSRLLDDLLELSRISRGVVELRRRSLSVADAVMDAVETSRPLIDAAGHALTVSVDEDPRGAPLLVDADPVRLAQVLSNLLNNAAKYTDHGGRIDLQARRENGHVAIAVRDNGIGIPPAMLPRVFDIFAQVHRDDARSQDGLGIGLSLVRSLVEMHGGRVEAHSEGPGRGSEFIVHLPLAIAAAAPPPTPHAIAQPRSTHVCRTLVVDDNRDAADSLRDMLRMMGAQAQAAYDGAAALRALDSFRPEAVLLDIGMPGMDGCEVARRIRASTAHADVLLIALTGWGLSEDRRRTRDAGFDHHLLKPVDVYALEAKLRCEHRHRGG